MAKKTPRFRPTQIVEPIQPTAIEWEENGVRMSDVFNPKHSRLRGDHPAVLAAPALFKPVQPDEDGD